MQKTASGLAAAGLLAPALALAQADATAPTDAGATSEPSATASASVAPSVVAPPPPPPRPAIAAHVASAAPLREKPAPSERGDHESVVHHLAVGYLGASQIPLAQGSPAALAQTTVTAPTLGARYWLDPHVGVDVGVGVGVATTSATQTIGGATTTNDSPAVVGFALHGGMPVALAYSKHFTFEIIPEIHFGYAGTTGKTTTTTGATEDVGLNGLVVNVGARLGAEIQFGFLGIPQLSLQGSIGLNLQYQTVWLSHGTDSASGSTLVFGTTIQHDPWAIFTDSIAALYYF